jgi:hypothetical protein
MEILANIPIYTQLFEPLNPIFFKQPRKLGLHSRIYLFENTEWPEGEEYFNQIFSGKLIGLQSLYELKPKQIMNLFLGKKLIVKCIRANRILPWIIKRFQLKKTIFIIRHPCAVIASQLKTGWCGYHKSSKPYLNIIPDKKTVLDEAAKIDLIQPNLLNKLKKIESKEEILATIWCLDNLIPLSYRKPHTWMTIVYEKLVKQGKQEIIKILNGLGEENNHEQILQSLKIPSGLAQKEDKKFVTDANIQLSKWKQKLSEKQIQKILKIVKDFELDFYTDDLEPDYEMLENF